jgi:predicted transcriptional regulator
MASAKDEVRQLLEQLPDDATYEDIQYRIFVRQKIERGIKDADDGKLVEQEEVEARMSRSAL